ncbi:MAG: hypothetical protein KDI06_21695, partial [Calditrichaeota bacterium]|nr:hypothetical protein [Calditrichota bacterium]
RNRPGRGPVPGFGSKMMFISGESFVNGWATDSQAVVALLLLTGGIPIFFTDNRNWYYELMFRNQPYFCYLTAKPRSREELICLVFARHRISVPTPAWGSRREPAIHIGPRITAGQADVPVQGQIRPVSVFAISQFRG